MDAASNNSVDDIRDLREKVAYAPVSGPPQGLHPRRGAHALPAGMERVPEDARGAAAADDLRAGHDRGAEGAPDGRRPLPPLRLRAADRRAGGDRARARRRPRGDRDREGRGGADRAPRHRQLPRRARARSSSSSPTPAAEPIEPADVLAVLGVADAEQLFEAVDAIIARDPAGRCGPRRSSRTRAADAGQLLRDLEVHGRELLAVQVLGDVPPRAAGHPGARHPSGRAGHRAVRHRRGPAARPGLGRARGDRQRRPGPDPARARAGQGGRARARSVDGGAAGPDRASRERAPRAPPAPACVPRTCAAGAGADTASGTRARRVGPSERCPRARA